MKLILIRHGQTIWNTQMRTQGHTDIPLDETGLEQADLLAQRLAKAQVSAIYASPLARAAGTARAIAQACNLPITEHALLMERNFGIWEGEPFKALLEKYPDGIRAWEQDPLGYTPPEAEPLADVLSRCTRFLHTLTNAHTQEQTIVVVGHSVPLRLMIAHLIGLPPQSIHSLRVDNAAYTELRLEQGRAVLMVLNDTSHLK